MSNQNLISGTAAAVIIVAAGANGAVIGAIIGAIIDQEAAERKYGKR